MKFSQSFQLQMEFGVIQNLKKPMFCMKKLNNNYFA